MRRRSAMKYLNNINKLQNMGKEKILMRKVESLAWTNEGTPMKSMTRFLKQVTDMVRGIRWETKSMEKEFCLKVIRKLPLEFGSGNAKETQSIKKWKTVGKLRRSLNKAAMVISEWDLQSPALKFLANEPLKNKSKVCVKSDPASKQRPKNPREESNSSEGTRRTTLEDGSVKHFLPKTWSKDKRKQYGMDHNFCLFCYTSNHRFDDCKLVKQRDAKKEKTVNEIENEVISGKKLEGGESSLEDEESVFVGVVEVLDVEEDYEEESEDFRLGFLDPVDLGEILVEDEFEVGGDVGKPHLTDKKVQQYLKSKVKEKVSSGAREGTITPNQAQEMESILLNHLEAFGSKIAKCDFNNLSPMKIKLREGVAEYVSKPYPMSKVSMEALKKKLRELEDMGMIRREPNPFFSSLVIMVPKPGKRDEYRMVVDLGRCNRSVKPTGAGLPDLETRVAWFKGTERYFGSFDGLSGFDYLRVDDGAQKYLGMVTPWGCYTMLMAPRDTLIPPNLFGNGFVTVLHHLPRETNALADLLTRWGYVESEDTLSLKAKLVDSNGDVGWRIRWKGITFFANSEDVDVEKMEIANMIDGPEGEEVLEVEVNKGTGWRFDPEVVKFVENRVAVHFPKRKKELRMLTMLEIVKIQEECGINLDKMEAPRNTSGAWINKNGKVIIPGELIE
eukprot:augustus_masked-scaffold_1-processed-gene-19.4-mRNA-1 protein AED:1.00 eAED:1.00 QI:0/0/0/0/1/1/3/0/672